MTSSVELRRSSIHGIGVYALRDFKTGEVVLRWDVSHIISNKELNSLSKDERAFTHPFNESSTLIVQPPERYVNHSCANNTVVRDFCDVAVRNISEGEEVTSDYSSNGAGLKFTCSCGAASCRGMIG
jgi:SET domain-containing protein